MGGVGGNVDREKHPVNSEVCVLFSCTTFVALTPAFFFFFKLWLCWVFVTVGFSLVSVHRLSSCVSWA